MLTSCSLSIYDLTLFFFAIYITIEYILRGILVFILIIIIRFKFSIFVPYSAYDLLSSFPFKLGISIQKLNELESFKYKNLKKRYNGIRISKDEKSCPICYYEFEDNHDIIILECNHFFHKSCCSKWLRINNSCPLCRKLIII